MTTSSAIKIIAAVLLATIAGDRLTAYGLERVVTRSHDRFISVYAGDLADGVLVLGNSRADRHFDPKQMREQLRRPVVNLGLGGNSTRMLEVLLNDAIERHGAPACVVLEVTSAVVDPASLGELKLLTALSPAMEDLLAEFSPAEARAGRLLHLFRFNTPMLVRVLRQIRRAAGPRLFRSALDEESVRDLNASDPIAEYRAFPANEDALRRIAASAAANGFHLTLVATPYAPGSAPAGLDEWLARIGDVQGASVSLRDYSRAIDDVSLFSDRKHMNRVGVRVLEGMMEADGALRCNGT